MESSDEGSNSKQQRDVVLCLEESKEAPDSSSGKSSFRIESRGDVRGKLEGDRSLELCAFP